MKTPLVLTPHDQLPLMDVLLRRHNGTVLLRMTTIIDGNSSNDLLDMIAYKIPMPTLWFKEERDGRYTPIGQFTKDVLQTLWDIWYSETLQRSIIRNALDMTDFEVNVVRCHADNADAIKIFTRVFKL